MSNLEFFSKVDKIKLVEPLGHILGLDEISIFSYEDVVKLSGHSCPTVAGAYLMCLYGLKEIYQNGDLPIRGEIKVELKDAKDKGIVGVIGNVASFITGAKEEDGFKGLNGDFSRNYKLFYNAKNIKGDIRFTRLDTNQFVDVIYNISQLELTFLDSILMQKTLHNQATIEEAKEFGKQWQARVAEILVDYKQKAIRIIK